MILACGASNPRDIPGAGKRGAKGIYFAVDFLGKVTKTLLDSDFEKVPFELAKNKNVLVIGGGDTGNDCVGTSIRLGAKSVTQLEMMPMPPKERAANNPWPQWPRILKTDYGQEEAIAVFGSDPRIYQTTAKRIHSPTKKEMCVKQKVVKLESRKDEKTGRMTMVPVEGSEKVIPADLVLIAAGFLGSQKYVTDAFKWRLTREQMWPRNRTGTPLRFPAFLRRGDMRRGQSLVVWAIREGRGSRQSGGRIPDGIYEPLICCTVKIPYILQKNTAHSQKEC